MIDLNASPHNGDTDWRIGARRFNYSLVMGLNVPRVDLNIDKKDSYILQSKWILFDSRFERKIHCFFMNISRRKMFQNRIVVLLILFLEIFYILIF